MERNGNERLFWFDASPEGGCFRKGSNGKREEMFLIVHSVIEVIASKGDRHGVGLSGRNNRSFFFLCVSAVRVKGEYMYTEFESTEFCRKDFTQICGVYIGH